MHEHLEEHSVIFILLTCVLVKDVEWSLNGNSEMTEKKFGKD